MNLVLNEFICSLSISWCQLNRNCLLQAVHQFSKKMPFYDYLGTWTKMLFLFLLVAFIYCLSLLDTKETDNKGNAREKNTYLSKSIN
jgi:hypothetical protein